VRLDRLDRDEQLLRDLLVGVSAGDQPQHLPLAGGQPVEVLVDRRDASPGEGVEHEAGQAGREDRVALGHPQIAEVSSSPVMVLVT
jgi:hypothetical protein